MHRARRTGWRADASVKVLRLVFYVLLIIGAIGAGAVAIRQLGALSWSLLGALPSPWNTVCHIAAQLAAIFAVAMLVTAVKAPIRWLILSAGGLVVAATPLALYALHGGWEARFFVPGGRFHRGSWTTVSGVVPETLIVAAAMVVAGLVGFWRARRRIKP